MKTQRSIEVMWEEYKAVAVPDGCSDVQLNETRYAFYAGASAIFHHMIRISEADAMGELDRLQAELRAHVDEIERLNAARRRGLN